MKKQLTIDSADDLPLVVKAILPIIKERKTIALIGEIGAGKTTFVSTLCQHIGVKNTTSSPTFSIINNYDSDWGPVYHIDLYRLKDEEEAFSIGLMELLEQEMYCFIEWPEIIENYLPDNTLWIKIKTGKNEERIFDIFYA